MQLPDNTRASWRHVLAVWEQEQARPLRFCPKLTQEHFDLPFGKKMSVSHAFQVISHSLAAATLTYISKKKLPEEAKFTAEFLERSNNLCDKGNSICPSAAGSKAPISRHTLESDVQQLSRDIDWVKSWRFEDQRTDPPSRRESLPFQKGLIITLSSLRGLCQFLILERGFAYVLTRKLNQDGLENLFSVVRRDRGGYNDHPEAQRAVQTLRLATCSQLLDSCSSRQANCEGTEDALLIHLGKPHFLVML